MDFQVGEKVVYPNQGIGVIESIQSRVTPSGHVSGYSLRLIADDSRVFVPRASARGVGLRPMIARAEAARILTELAEVRVSRHSSWKGRFKENSEKMRTGSLFEVAVVLKALSVLSRSQVLSFREKRMLERARFLVVSEIAEVQRKSRASIERQVDAALADPPPDEPRPSQQRPVGARRRADA